MSTHGSRQSEQGNDQDPQEAAERKIQHQGSRIAEVLPGNFSRSSERKSVDWAAELYQTTSEEVWNGRLQTSEYPSECRPATGSSKGWRGVDGPDQISVLDRKPDVPVHLHST